MITFYLWEGGGGWVSNFFSIKSEVEIFFEVFFNECISANVFWIFFNECISGIIFQVRSSCLIRVFFFKRFTVLFEKKMFYIFLLILFFFSRNLKKCKKILVRILRGFWPKKIAFFEISQKKTFSTEKRFLTVIYIKTHKRILAELEQILMLN